jgi:predicted nucleotidyltransferase component of viral defense system
MQTMRTRTDLLEVAGRYANERRAPVETIINEILHYEILFALRESGADLNLTFQGGTALRLCYQGTRYSEDLNFAGGTEFDASSMSGFADLLRNEIASAYGLDVEIKPPKSQAEESGVAVARWHAKVHIPQVNRSATQKQVINIEVASVPAYEPDLVGVAANYSHLPTPFRQMLVTAETPGEIMADKLVALGARDYFKARDIWDMKFLTDRGIRPSMDLVAKKLRDYHWNINDFKVRLEGRLIDLDSPEVATAFQAEMSRFVDARLTTQLKNPSITGNYLRQARDLGKVVLEADLSTPQKEEQAAEQEERHDTPRPRTRP